MAYVPICEGTITATAGSLSCDTGWMVLDYSPLFPPITLEQGAELLTGVITLWSLAYAIHIVKKTVDARY